MPVGEAIEEAAERGLDLVEVGATSKPPVCRIMDYGKFKYQASKRQHEAKKKQTKIVIKEIKLRPKTEEHDFNFKVKHAGQFLDDGNKVKVTVMYRGREMAHRDLGIAVLDRFAESLTEKGAIEQEPRAEGRTAMMVLAPKKSN
jgi:translation initiation factor IF-3